MENLKLWIAKMATMFPGDRRAVVFVIALILTFVGIPHTAEGVDSTTVTALVVLIQGAIVLVGSTGLIKSWETRPPSGLKYREVLEKILRGDTPEGEFLRDMLADAGVKLE